MWSLSTTLLSSSLFIIPAVLAIPSTTATDATASSNTTVEMVSAAWFAGWHATEGFAVANVSWEKYTHMTYSFA